MSGKSIQPSDLFFSLDIGTRSVMGILGRVQGDVVFIDHAALEFHKKRSMIDGQIHDIEQVAECVQLVKNKLEQESGYKLQNVAIAAAGRALKTVRINKHVDIDEHVLIDQNMIKSLEIELIQEAQKVLLEESKEKTVYYNVGYTVINYYLDDSMIMNLVGHKGKRISADVIGTFLPQIVVDSLEEVMNRVGLNVAFMTLEPIAAIEVAVPVGARLLNLALVDIGAGTSDIAITKDGSVVAYAMASTAGDEITECIATNYLLDFDSAEKLKCNLKEEANQVFYDIVGMKVEETTEAILDKIEPAIEVVATNIVEHILLQNGKSPSAVFMIGGGSQIPRLNEKIAEKLEIPKERVVIKGAEQLNHLSKEGVDLQGPETVTPIGIMVACAKNQKNDFMDIKVNGKSVRMFRSADMKVSDALVLSGFNPRDLIPKKGKSLNILINGVPKIYYGKYGEEAKIYINGTAGNLDSRIQEASEIVIEPAVQGKNIELKISELEDLAKKIHVDGQSYPYVDQVKINGKEFRDKEDRLLIGGDAVTYDLLDKIHKVAQYLELDINKYHFTVNGSDASPNTSIQPEDRIETHLKESVQKKEPLPTQPSAPKEPEQTIMVLCNGKPVELKGNKSQFIFLDIFDFIDFDRSRTNGKLITIHNGEPAHYTSPLRSGDVVAIRWE